MHVHGHQRPRLGRGEPQHLRRQPVNPLQLAAHHFGQFAVLLFFEQHFDERVDGHEAILDFVGDAGGEKAEIGQPVKALKIVFVLARR